MINEISQNCEILRLTGILQSYQSIADECGKVKASYSEYLDQILKHELMLREQRSREILLKMAGFPVLKTFEGGEF